MLMLNFKRDVDNVLSTNISYSGHGTFLASFLVFLSGFVFLSLGVSEFLYIS